MSEVLARQREVAIGKLEQIPPGEGRAFEVGDLMVAVFRTRAGEIYASQPNCPHRAGPLADGMLGGRTIMCPLHDRLYDLASGKEIGGDCAIATYPIRRETDGTLFLTVPADP